MKTTATILACVLCSYLAGGFNPAIALSVAIYRKDIRGLGSGNPGFTNFMRVFGKRWAWLVLALDVSKAIVLCAVFGPLFGSVLGSFRLGAAVSGLFAILGHCFPVWYGFDGGKGFLAFITAAFFIDWRVGLVGAAVLLAVFFTSHYMSLASILTVVVTASATAVMYRQETWTVVCFSLGALTVILRHGENIRRLVSGTEKKLDIGNRKNR